MKILSAISTLFIACILFLKAGAQSPDPRYKTVDEYVKALGSLDTLNMGTISYVVTKKFDNNTEKVRAIFDWIAYNISMDIKAAKNNSNEKMTSDEVLKTRKANAYGYAALFQDMCSVAKIRCLTVDGYIKKSPEQIGEIPDEFNHTWAVIQLGQSPETWYYVDPAMGSGHIDEKGTSFIKQYNDAYFFANKTIFNLQHYPDNMAWQLGNSGPKSLKDFMAMPVIMDAAYEFGVSGITMPLTGSFKASTQKQAAFSLKLRSDTKIDIVSLQLGTDKKKRTKTVDYSQNGSSLSFNFKFDEEDSYPVKVLINNKPVIGFLAEITE